MLGIHPDAFGCREGLYDDGVGYNQPMELLLVSKKCCGDQELTDLHVSIWCPSLLVELMRHPYNKTIVGVQFVQTAELAWRYRNELPILDPCPAIWASDLTDRHLADSYHVRTKDERQLISEMHAEARRQAECVSTIPPQIITRMREHMRAIELRFN